MAEACTFLVTPTGSAYWRLKYRVAGKEKVLALGVYCDAEGTEQVSLTEARFRVNPGENAYNVTTALSAAPRSWSK